MTHRNDDQSFEDSLDNAVREMHQQMPRGNRPSSRAWKLLAEQASIEESVRDGSRPVLSTVRKRTSSGDHEPQVSGGLNRHLGWSTWLAAALMVILIGASVNFLMPVRNDGGNIAEHSIALAPGTPDLSALQPGEVASPSASPDMYIPVHGPEFACGVEPLTEEEVYQIVLNPGNRWTALAPEVSHNSGGLYENSDHWMQVDWERDASKSFAASDESAVTDPIIETANTFWKCLMTGSALQVWALMNPYAVQFEILKQYPVFRDEATIRKHIEKWGPMRYSASIFHVFPDLGNVPPYQASMHVSEEYGSVRIGYSQGDPWKSVVIMESHPDYDGYNQRHLLLTRAPDGTWWVYMIFWEY